MIWPLALVVGVWFFASLIIGRIYPEAIQRFTVDPNQYAQEERFIANNIAMTRLAYGIDRWDNRSFRGEDVLTQAAIDDEDDTFRNARLWDYRPLGNSLDQLQTIRRFYNFTDVDTDRYMIDGVQRQVMLSARELDLARNPLVTGWVNERIIYTHGIGVAMVPVNEVANEGQPRLFIRNRRAGRAGFRGDRRAALGAGRGLHARDARRRVHPGDHGSWGDAVHAHATRLRPLPARSGLRRARTRSRRRAAGPPRADAAAA
jgi:uncharacterized membrane protein (UPF0182 family)